MRTAFRLLTICCLIRHFSANEVHADGGTIRLRETRGPIQITVFTAPTPFRAGDVDVSVLVQDLQANPLAQDAHITIIAQPRVVPSVPLRIPATRAAATNKLLQSAKFPLREPGWWRLDVVLETGDSVEHFEFDVEALPALPRWITFWPWFSWPAAVIALFVWHNRLAPCQPAPGDPGDTPIAGSRLIR